MRPPARPRCPRPRAVAPRVPLSLAAASRADGQHAAGGRGGAGAACAWLRCLQCRRHALVKAVRDRSARAWLLPQEPGRAIPDQSSAAPRLYPRAPPHRGRRRRAAPARPAPARRPVPLPCVPLGARAGATGVHLQPTRSTNIKRTCRARCARAHTRAYPRTHAHAHTHARTHTRRSWHD